MNPLGRCDNERMENSELSIPAAPAQVAPAAAATRAPTRTAREPLRRARRATGPLQRRTLRERIGGALAAIVALVAKFFAAIKGVILLLPESARALTALVSVAAYSLWFGWWFAVGFVLLLFVHEMGHVIALRREGIKASAPMFIPFMGAVITSKSLGDNALAEARVGLAGPVLGTVGAAVCLVDRRGHQQRLLPGARLHRLLPEPLQPAAGRAARRRPRDGGDGAVDVVPRLRRAGRARPAVPEPDPADHHAVRRLRALPPLAGAQIRLGRAGRLLPRLAAPPAARRRRLHRPDRAARARHGAEPHPQLRRAQLPLDAS